MQLQWSIELAEHRVLEYEFKRRHKLQQVKNIEFVKYLQWQLRKHVVQVVETNASTWCFATVLVSLLFILPDADCDTDPGTDCDRWPALGVQDMNSLNLILFIVCSWLLVLLTWLLTYYARWVYKKEIREVEALD